MTQANEASKAGDPALLLDELDRHIDQLESNASTQEELQEIALRLRQSCLKLQLENAGNKAADEKLRLHYEQLIHADKMKTLGVLVAGVAHEINNPNNSIRINISLIKKIADDALPFFLEYATEHNISPGGIPVDCFESSVYDLIGGIKQGSERIGLIVESLSGYGRRTSHDALEVFGLNEVVKNSVFLLDSLIRKSTNHFNVVEKSGLPPVKGVARRIEQVAVNVIQNACQSLPEPTSGIEVRIYARNRKRETVLEVIDEGRGINSSDLNHITDPFFTTKRESGGTGLGLSISASILKDHKGYFEFDSVPGEGTAVRIVLPAVKRAAHKSKQGEIV